MAWRSVRFHVVATLAMALPLAEAVAWQHRRDRPSTANSPGSVAVAGAHGGGSRGAVSQGHATLRSASEIKNMIEEGIAKADVDVAARRLSLPDDVSSLVKAGSASRAKFGPQEEAAATETVEKLNEMITATQNKLDTTYIACQEKISLLTENTDQAWADVITLGNTISYTDSVWKAAVDRVNDAKDKQEKARDLLEDLEDRQEEVDLLKHELEQAKTDAQVGEFLLNYTKSENCTSIEDAAAALVGGNESATPVGGSKSAPTGGGAFLQRRAATSYEICARPQNTSLQLQFGDRRLRKQWRRLTSDGRLLLQRALVRSEIRRAGSAKESLTLGLAESLGVADDLDDGVVAHARRGESALAQQRLQRRGFSLAAVGQLPINQPQSPQPISSPTLPADLSDHPGPTSVREVCSIFEPDCDLLHDAVASIWGEMKDTVEKLEHDIAEKEKDFKEVRQRLVEELDELDSIIATDQGRVDDALTTGGNLKTEKDTQEKLHEDLKKELEDTTEQCNDQVDHIAETEICSLTKVRDALVKAIFDTVYVSDCMVSGWSDVVCPITCDDTMEGALVTLTRVVESMNTTYGAACPMLEIQTRCGKRKCPVNCKLSDFSPFTACDKPCGIGQQHRVRTVESPGKNGGAGCPSLTDTQVCYAGACGNADCAVADWSPWSQCDKLCGTDRSKARNKAVVSQQGKGGQPCPATLETATCPDARCFGDETCTSPFDLAVLMDGSGSITDEGFNVLKKLAGAVMSRLKNATGVTYSLGQFGNGELVRLAENQNLTVREAIHVKGPADVDWAAVDQAVQALPWKKGFTNMAQGAVLAHNLLNDGRKGVKHFALFITDGLPSYGYSTNQAFEDLKHIAQPVMVQVKLSPSEESVKLMKHYATGAPGFPTAYVGTSKEELDGADGGPEQYDAVAADIFSMLCSQATSAMLDSAPPTVG